MTSTKLGKISLAESGQGKDPILLKYSGCTVHQIKSSGQTVSVIIFLKDRAIFSLFITWTFEAITTRLGHFKRRKLWEKANCYLISAVNQCYIKRREKGLYLIGRVFGDTTRCKIRFWIRY